MRLSPSRTPGHVALTTYDYDEFSVRSERFRYIRYIDGSEELYDHETDLEEWNNLAANPKFARFKDQLAARIPQDAAPLVKTSEKLQPHHIPPFPSRDDYEEWRRHGRDNQYLIRKYWQ